MQERHPLDLVSLIFGLIFATLALLTLVSPDPIDVNLKWFGPIAVIALGLVVAIPAFRNRPAATEFDDVDRVALDELPEQPDL